MSTLTPSAVLVRDTLLSHGLENPIVEKIQSMDHKMCKRLIADHIFAIMNILNLDICNNSLLNTPQRIASMYIEEIFSGLDYLNFPKITIIENTGNIDQLITIKDINFTSTCEHHFIVFDGTIHVSYFPEKYILGLSKIYKIIRFFSNRPQLQERLIQQILLVLQTLLKTKNIAILINAVHYCVKARGIRDMTSVVTTTAFGGIFKSDLGFRNEFLRSVSY